MTRLFIVSDIFGRTPALERLADQLVLPGYHYEILDPYKGIDQKFPSEVAAYEQFMVRIGLDDYIVRIKENLTGCREPARIIAFSVGASAVWRICGMAGIENVSDAVCYYPSQIRYFPGIQPEFNIELIFPLTEPRFDVDEMIAAQDRKPRVSCRKEKGGHGFMNALSANYDDALYRSECRRLRRILQSG